MMRFRLVLLVGLACWAGAARAQSLLGNAQDNGDTVAVPPAPPIVAAPPAAPVVQPAPQPQPPGLVQTPLPPPNNDAGAAETAPVDNGQPAAAPAGQIPAGQAPAGQAPAATAAAQTPPASVPDTSASLPPPLDNAWVPGHTAEIGILDKVDGGASTVSVPVGGQTVVGDLQINVLACETRPPADVPDDAIFVAIQPANGQGAAPAADGSDTAPFRGWMVRSIPAATVVGDGSETLRVVGCS